MTKFPDANGFYGEFGGAFIPELLWANIAELTDNYEAILNSDSFNNEFNELLHDYVGRPTPLFFAQNLSKRYGAKIYLKREDLCHTGAHKLNNVLGQILLAKQLGKKRIIAETGAGQHGVATATACALMGLKCTVFMGAKDAVRQKPNLLRMRMLGAEIIEVRSGSQTLKDATNDAIRYWINNPSNTHYLIGSTIGPHPYPDLVARLQSVISEEIKNQLHLKENTPYPNYVIACVGGGSNAAGAFFHFIGNERVKLVGVEAGGIKDDTSKTAASILNGEVGIIHGCKTYLLQNDDGQIVEAHSVSAGLDYPGIGPLHAQLNKNHLAKYIAVYDHEAIDAALALTRLEGIIPALESAHAIAALDKLKFKSTDIVVVNLSGRGDKDLDTYKLYFESDTENE